MGVALSGEVASLRIYFYKNKKMKIHWATSHNWHYTSLDCSKKILFECKLKFSHDEAFKFKTLGFQLIDIRAKVSEDVNCIIDFNM